MINREKVSYTPCGPTHTPAPGSHKKESHNLTHLHSYIQLHMYQQTAVSLYLSNSMHSFWLEPATQTTDVLVYIIPAYTKDTTTKNKNDNENGYVNRICRCNEI